MMFSFSAVPSVGEFASAVCRPAAVFSTLLLAETNISHRVEATIK